MERVLTLHKTVPATELPSHISSILWNVDDTIASKTKPSSQALHPIEEAYFHQSHLKGKQDYGHQAVAVMLSCNGIVLNYAFVLYNKSISKIDIVQNIAEKLPESPVPIPDIAKHTCILISLFWIHSPDIMSQHIINFLTVFYLKFWAALVALQNPFPNLPFPGLQCVSAVSFFLYL